jgi:ubiquinol-cytochrome c reductase cytochrome b subunit
VSGMIIFVLSCGIAFFGYSLPLGQMSFWAIIVIFNLLSVFPHGDLIIVYLFGGFSPTSRTISLLFLLHYLLPFVLLVLVVSHLSLLHLSLSSNSLNISNLDLINFLDFFLIIDLFVVFIFFLGMSFLIFFFPFMLFEAVNFNQLNMLSTPLHIIPDWFLLFPYVCLRAFHNKVLGIIVLLVILFSFFYKNLF